MQRFELLSKRSHLLLGKIIRNNGGNQSFAKIFVKTSALPQTSCGLDVYLADSGHFTKQSRPSYWSIFSRQPSHLDWDTRTRRMFTSPRSRQLNISISLSVTCWTSLSRVCSTGGSKLSVCSQHLAPARFNFWNHERNTSNLGGFAPYDICNRFRLFLISTALKVTRSSQIVEALPLRPASSASK